MEFNKYVNLQNVSDFLTNEIKEISERWGQFMIKKIALERVLTITAFPDEVEQNYKTVLETIENKKNKKNLNISVLFSQNILDDYNKIKEYKEKESALENAHKGLKEFVEFLEVATELKNEVDEFLRKKKVVTGE